MYLHCNCVIYSIILIFVSLICAVFVQLHICFILFVFCCFFLFFIGIEIFKKTKQIEIFQMKYFTLTSLVVGM